MPKFPCKTSESWVLVGVQGNARRGDIQATNWCSETRYRVFRENCYDEDPELKWNHKARYSKAALSEAQVAKRYKFAQEVQKIPRTSR